MLAEAIAKSLGMELLIWNIKSTTRAQDGLYVYDTVQRLYDSQFGTEGVNDIGKYIRLGKLGEAFKATVRPIVIITSNAEKELPDAFLRRCIFHYIAFPDASMMERIIKAHYPDLEQKLIDGVLEAFYKIRDIRGLQKKPSTSEVLDWIQALSIGGIPVKKLEREIPFAGVLLKKTEDLKQVERKNVY